MLVAAGALELAAFRDEELALAHLRQMFGASFDEAFLSDVWARAARLASLEADPW